MTTLQNPPKGYRWVRVGHRVRTGDKWFNFGIWQETELQGCTACEQEYIRRIRTTKKGRKKK